MSTTERAVARRTQIVVLTASTRPGALGPVIGEWFRSVAAGGADELNCEIRQVSLAELALPLLDEQEHPSSGMYRHEHTKRWSSIVAAADGFIVITPEYNYGMPATLKNALDYLGIEWAYKPMGFVSYGNTSAGTRSVQHAKQATSTMRLVAPGATVAIRIGDSIREGSLVDDPQRDEAASELLEETVRLAQALRPMREQLAITSIGGPVAGSYLRPLGVADAADLLVLQRCAWVDEAHANETLDIRALHESEKDLASWLHEWRAWGLWLDGRLIASVRARAVGDEWQIGRLATVPDARKRGIGSWLLAYAEQHAPDGTRVLTMSTGRSSTGNIRLYESAGWKVGGVDGNDLHLSKQLVGTG